MAVRDSSTDNLGLVTTEKDHRPFASGLRWLVVGFSVGFASLTVGALMGSYVALFGVMLASYLGCGWLIARRARTALWRCWGGMVGLNAPLWLLLMINVVFDNNDPEAVLYSCAICAAGWLATSASAYLASRRVMHTAGAKTTLALLGVPVLAFSGMGLFSYTTGRRLSYFNTGDTRTVAGQ